MLCPCCRVRVAPIEQQGIMATQCRQCKGIWISAIALERLKNKNAQTAKTEAAPFAELAEEVAKTDSTHELECSVCGKGMEKTRFHPMIPVQVDQCTACGYVWLDAGEQQMLLELYREMMTSDDATVKDRRDKLKRLDQMRFQMQSQMNRDFDHDTKAVDRTINMGRNAATGNLVEFVGDVAGLIASMWLSRKR